MLQQIRDKTQGFIAWSIVILITVIFAAWGANNYLAPGGREAVAAVVNGKKITWNKVDMLYQQMLREHLSQNQSADLSHVDVKSLKSEARNQLIREAVMLMGCAKEGFYVSDEQALQFLVQQIPEFQENGTFSREKFQSFMGHAGYTEADFLTYIHNSLVLSQMENGLKLSSFSLKPEVQQLIHLQNQKRDIGYAVIPADRFVSKIKVTDEEQQQFYNENQSLYVAPEKVKIAYVDLSIDELMDQVKVDDAALKAFYDHHKDYYTTPERVKVRHLLISAEKGSDAEKSGEARAKINDLLAQLKLGADFAELSKKHSEDPASAKNGGDLGWFGHKEMEPSFEEAAFALKKAGDLSEVVRTPYGYHILQLMDRKNAELQPFQDVKEEVSRQYRREQAETSFSEKGEELANMTFEQSDSLEPAAKELGLSVKTSDLFTREGGEGILKVQAVVQAAFSGEVLNGKRNSELLKVGDEQYVVLRVLEHEPSRSLSFEEVETQVKESLIAKRAKEQAESVGQDMIKALKEKALPNQVSKDQGVEWQLKLGLSRMDTDFNPILMREAFALPRPSVEEPHPLRGFSLPNGDFVVLALSSVQIGTLEDENTHMASLFKHHLALMFSQMEYNLYQSSLMKQAQIELKKIP